jgi:hypothetical protein
MLVRKAGGLSIGWGSRDIDREKCIDVFANPTRSTPGLKYCVHAPGKGYVQTLFPPSELSLESVQFGDPGSFAGPWPDRGFPM